MFSNIDQEQIGNGFFNDDNHNLTCTTDPSVVVDSMNPSVVNKKTLPMILATGTGKTYNFETDKNGVYMLNTGVYHTIRSAISYSASVKIDGQNIIIGTHNDRLLIFRRYDWRSRVAILINGKFYPLFDKFIVPKGISKDDKQLFCETLKTPIENSTYVVVGKCDRLPYPHDVIGKISYVTLAQNMPIIFGEENNIGFPEIIYVADPNIQCVDLIVPSNGIPTLMHNVPLATVMLLHGNHTQLTFEEISLNVQGGKYRNIGLRQNIITIVGHGVFPAKMPLPDLPSTKNVTDDEISKFVEKLYRATIVFSFPETGLWREGVVFRFDLPDGDYQLYKINQGQMQTYAKMCNIVLPIENENELRMD